MLRPRPIPIMQLTKLFSVFLLHALSASLLVSAEFRAGAAVVDVTPVQLPVIVNGSMLSRTTD